MWYHSVLAYGCRKGGLITHLLQATLYKCVCNKGTHFENLTSLICRYCYYGAKNTTVSFFTTHNHAEKIGKLSEHVTAYKFRMARAKFLHYSTV